MRNIVNISLPEELHKEVKKVVANGEFATKSEFFRHLLRLWKKEQAYQRLQQAKRELKQGKGIILKSLKDLR